MNKTGMPIEGEFYMLEPDMRRGGSGHGVVFENLLQLLTPPRRILHPEGVGFPPLKEKPRLSYDPKQGEPPEDLEGGLSGYWLVSQRLKDAFQSVDRAGFEFVECDYKREDGSPGPRRYLCDVVRVLDALDEDASRLNVKISDDYPGGKFYNLAGGAHLAFRKEAVGQAHVFRLPFAGDLVFCDRMLRDAVHNAGISANGKSDGLWFVDAADI